MKHDLELFIESVLHGHPLSTINFADHERAFIAAAVRLRESDWWHTIPVYIEPAPVSGEIG